MIPAIIYARVSSREHEQEGYSIPAQLKLLRNYAEKNGVEILREFVDIETAKTTGRKAFGEMLEFLRKSKNCHTVLVEKTDRLYRNMRDAVMVEDLDTEIHFVKENQVLSKNSRSQDKLTHGLHLLIARNYVENLREEVIKGMREKAEQGIYPGHAPFGYINNRATRGIDVHAEESVIVKRIFELYATGKFPLTVLRKAIKNEFGKVLNRSNLHKILNNRIYIGYFEWRGESYKGKHEPIISPQIFENCQAVMHGYNKGKYRKHDIAFRGMLT
jgi:DNA invertase Pin-like site-specific DNA recombinase